MMRRGGWLLTWALLLLSSFQPGLAATCTGDPAAEQSLGLVHEAFDILSDLHIESPTPAQLLPPARGALPNQLPADRTGAQMPSWATFADAWCAAWPDQAQGPGAMAYAAISAMVEALHDPSTQFLTPPAYQQFQGRGPAAGIGVVLAPEPLRVKAVFPHSPAAQAELKPGDRILAIDGEPAAQMSIVDAFLAINGEAATAVELTIEAPDAPGARDIELVRTQIAVPQTEFSLMGAVAYLRIRDFSRVDLSLEVIPRLRLDAARSASTVSRATRLDADMRLITISP